MFCAFTPILHGGLFILIILVPTAKMSNDRLLYGLFIIRMSNLGAYIHIRLMEVDIRNQTENNTLTSRKVIDDEIMLNKVAVTN